MTSTSTRRHGKIVHIEEIQAQSMSGSSVRVIGTLLTYDTNTSLAVIEHARSQLVVDLSLLGPFSNRTKSLLQFIGEVETWQPPPNLPFSCLPSASRNYLILRARIARNVDGLDLSMYDQALQIRRKFEVERESLNF
ncbi:uncharacterized protein SPPG_07312, partial [Spizellomyces punctatus DAOM BR117]